MSLMIFPLGNFAGQRTTAGHAKTAFPGKSFFTSKRLIAALRPGEDFGAVIGREHDDRVIGDSEFVQLVEQSADHIIQFHHAVREDAVTRLVFPLFTLANPDMIPRGVVPQEKRFPGFVRLVDERQ